MVRKKNFLSNNSMNVIVTGANSGIGLSTVKLLLERDIFVYACVRNNSCNLDKIKSSHLRIFRFDLLDLDSMKENIKEIFKMSNGDIFGLVNSAGVAHGGLFNMTSLEKIKETFDINFFSQLQLIQLVSKKMIANKKGSIINIASTAGIFSDAGTLAYGASKSALIYSTRVLGVELGKFNIRVNSISPALVQTDMLKLMDQSSQELITSRKSLPGNISPSDVANLIFFLLSEDSSKVNAQNLRIDQGMFA